MLVGMGGQSETVWSEQLLGLGMDVDPSKHHYSAESPSSNLAS